MFHCAFNKQQNESKAKLAQVFPVVREDQHLIIPRSAEVPLSLVNLPRRRLRAPDLAAQSPIQGKYSST